MDNLEEVRVLQERYNKLLDEIFDGRTPYGAPWTDSRFMQLFQARITHLRVRAADAAKWDAIKELAWEIGRAAKQ